MGTRPSQPTTPPSPSPSLCHMNLQWFLGDRSKFRATMNAGTGGTKKILWIRKATSIVNAISTIPKRRRGCRAGTADNPPPHGSKTRPPSTTVEDGCCQSPPNPNPTSASSASHAVKWKRGELVGKGSSGSVYQALDGRDGKFMAVKCIRLRKPSRLSDREKSVVAAEKDMVLALEEIHTMKNLEHENVVRYKGYERTESGLNLFMEYVSGGSLADIVQRFGPLSSGLIAFYMCQVLSALVYIHGKGIVHRDIKAANILLTNNGTCKLADFGASINLNRPGPTGSEALIARGKSHSQDIDCTPPAAPCSQGRPPPGRVEQARGGTYSAPIDHAEATGATGGRRGGVTTERVEGVDPIVPLPPPGAKDSAGGQGVRGGHGDWGRGRGGCRRNRVLIRGSAYWMAPEAIRHEYPTTALDVWSLGCTVAELATGRPPFSHFDTPICALYNISMLQEPPELTGLGGRMCPVGRDFVRSCLHPDPTSRPSADKLEGHRFLRSSPVCRHHHRHRHCHRHRHRHRHHHHHHCS
ncbi:unnamed protein product, partial [Discosporangium mesarthrocarpum]